MKQVKIDIFNAFTASVALNAIVASDENSMKQIFAAWPPANSLYPRVGFYQVSGRRGVADGKMSQNINELYSVDIFAKTMLETEDAAEAIDDAMDTLPYIVSREGDLDLYEEDTGVHHKVLRYRIK